METLRSSLHRRSVRYKQRSKTLVQGSTQRGSSCLHVSIREIALELREEAKIVPDSLRLRLAPAHTSHLLNGKACLVSKSVKFEASLRSVYSGYAFFEPPFWATVNLFSDQMDLTLSLEMLKSEKRHKVLAKTRFLPESLPIDKETSLKLFAESSKVAKCHVVVRVDDTDRKDVGDNALESLNGDQEAHFIKSEVKEDEDVAQALKEALETTSKGPISKDTKKHVRRPSDDALLASKATPVTHDASAAIRRRSLLSSYDSPETTKDKEEEATVMSPAMRAYEAEQAILKWANDTLQPCKYEMNIGEVNLNTSWQDFELFNLLISAAYPDLVSIKEIKAREPKDNLKILDALNSTLCLGLVLEGDEKTKMSQTKVQMMLEQLRKTLSNADPKLISSETLKAWKNKRREIGLDKSVKPEEKIAEKEATRKQEIIDDKVQEKEVSKANQETVKESKELSTPQTETVSPNEKTPGFFESLTHVTVESSDIRSPQSLKLMPIASPALRRSSFESTQQSDNQSLLTWAKTTLKDYASIKITNLSSSFQNGLAFCCLLHTIYPDLVPLKDLNPSYASVNFNFLLALNDFLGLNVTLDNNQPLNQSKVKSLLDQLRQIISECHENKRKVEKDNESIQNFKQIMRNELGLFSELSVDLKARVQELIDEATVQEDQQKQEESRSVRNSGIFVASLEGNTDTTMEEVSEELKALEEQAKRLEDEQEQLQEEVRKDESEEALQKLIVIIDQKNALVRRQMQLNLLEKEAIITAKQRKIQSALQTISETSDRLRTEAIIEREQQLLDELVALVNEKNELVHTLDSQEKAIDVDDDIRAKLATNDYNKNSSAAKEECIVM